jgi:hypothetical protein
MRSLRNQNQRKKPVVIKDAPRKVLFDPKNPRGVVEKVEKLLPVEVAPPPLNAKYKTFKSAQRHVPPKIVPLTSMTPVAPQVTTQAATQDPTSSVETINQPHARLTEPTAPAFAVNVSNVSQFLPEIPKKFNW